MELNKLLERKCFRFDSRLVTSAAKLIPALPPPPPSSSPLPPPPPPPSSRFTILHPRHKHYESDFRFTRP